MKVAKTVPRTTLIFRRRNRAARPDALVWEDDITGRCARLTAVGSRRLLIENHTGILELTPERVTVSTGCGPLGIFGLGLSVCEARRDAMIIRGEIVRIDLPPEGGEDREG